MKELLGRYLQGRVELGEPELLLRSLGRREALVRARHLANVGASRAVASTRSSPAAVPSPPSPASAPSSQEIERLGREATAEEIAELGRLSGVHQVALACTRCPLHETRRTVVFGEGDPEARVVCVGEAPGASEDETGRPFVGRAGQLLDRLLLSAGFPREEVYICNVLKCRPPGNRNPLPEEIESCSPFLLRQLDLIDPEVVVAFGTFAARTLLGTRESLGRLRGRTHLFRGYPVVVTYHPAALLRNPGWTRPTWEDLQTVRHMLDEGASKPPGNGARAEDGHG